MTLTIHEKPKLVPIDVNRREAEKLFPDKIVHCIFSALSALGILPPNKSSWVVKERTLRAKLRRGADGLPHLVVQSRISGTRKKLWRGFPLDGPATCISCLTMKDNQGNRDECATHQKFKHLEVQGAVLYRDVKPYRTDGKGTEKIAAIAPLFDCDLHSHCEHADLPTKLKAMFQAAEKLAQFHEKGVHGDVKFRNFVLNRHEETELPTVSLVDLGSARKIGEPICVCGTPQYYAPEIAATYLPPPIETHLSPPTLAAPDAETVILPPFDPNAPVLLPEDQGPLGKTTEAVPAQDVWAFANMLYELFEGSVPSFQLILADAIHEYHFGNGRGYCRMPHLTQEGIDQVIDASTKIPSSYKALLKGMFRLAPNERSSMEDVLARWRPLVLSERLLSPQLPLF
jgi:hypothetical protein